MDKENIPKTLHFLIPMAEEWGIGDDGYRDEKIENASNEELTELVKFFTDDIAKDFNNWLGKPNPVEPQSEEYYVFSSFFMTFEYGNAVLKSRSK